MNHELASNEVIIGVNQAQERGAVLKMTPMAVKAELKNIQSRRALFLQENNSQVRFNACHERSWTDSYLLTINDLEIGYGSIKGHQIAARDKVLEFYVTPSFRKLSSMVSVELLAASGAKFVECQSNDLLLSSMLYEFSWPEGIAVIGCLGLA